MKAKRTPGPRKWLVDESGYYIVVAGGYFGEPVTVACSPSPHTWKEADRNLIVAAPELLEACKGLVKSLEHDIPGIKGNMAGAGLGVEYKFALAIIAKAEGK